MQIRFSPPWETMPDIDKASAVKKLELLQGEFFNWLYDTPATFSSKLFPAANVETIYKALMAPPLMPKQYYDQVINLVVSGEHGTLADLYGLPVETPLRWHFSYRDDCVLARLLPAIGAAGGFFIHEETTAQKKFCAELFSFVRQKTKVVDDSYSTSTQFANNEVLTQLYCCHLS